MADADTQVTSEAPDRQDSGQPEDGGRLAMRIVRRLAETQLSWLIGVLISIIVVFQILSPEFLSTTNIKNFSIDASTLLVIAVGMTFVIATAGIDLSVGAVLVFSQIVAATVLKGMPNASLGELIVVGAVISAGCGMGWGLINGFLIAVARIPPLIATLGTLGAATGAGLLISSGIDVAGVPPSLARDFGNGSVAGIPWIVVCAFAVAFIGMFALSHTIFGRYTIAIGSSESAAERAGVNVTFHLLKIYVLSGMLAGFAGFLALALYGSTTISGHTTDNLNSVAAVVIGGTSLFGGVASILGTIIGVFIPAILENGFVIEGLQPYWQQIAVAAVLVIAVYLDQRRRRSAQRR